MKIILKVAFSLYLIGFSAGLAQELAPVAITIDPQASGIAIPDDFSGFSFEMADVEKKHFFNPKNEQLIALFKTLGVKSLRMGGNSADGIYPFPDEIDRLFGFAKAADLKVIYTLRLHGSNPNFAASDAGYIAKHYQSELDCFAIGNEPDMYFQYPDYQVHWSKYVARITSVFPAAKFCGPSVATSWWAPYMTNMVQDLRETGQLNFFCWHNYPNGFGPKMTNGVAGRDAMLSPHEWAGLQPLYETFAIPVVTNGLAYRLDEVNNYWGGGAKDASDTFAAALWSLEYLYWWAAHKAGGINFHTGDLIPDNKRPFYYAAFWTAGTGYDVHPLSYGIKAFDLGSHGNLLPVILSNTNHLNLSAYAVRGPDQNLFVTVINKEHDQHARAAAVTISPGTTISAAKTIFLIAPEGDVAAKTGVTIGNSSINKDGTWNGQWTDATVTPAAKSFALEVPAASAVIVKLSP